MLLRSGVLRGVGVKSLPDGEMPHESGMRRNLFLLPFLGDGLVGPTPRIVDCIQRRLTERCHLRCLSTAKRNLRRINQFELDEVRRVALPCRAEPKIAIAPEDQQFRVLDSERPQWLGGRAEGPGMTGQASCFKQAPLTPPRGFHETRFAHLYRTFRDSRTAI